MSGSNEDSVARKSDISKMKFFKFLSIKILNNLYTGKNIFTTKIVGPTTHFFQCSLIYYILIASKIITHTLN